MMHETSGETIVIEDDASGRGSTIQMRALEEFGEREGYLAVSSHGREEGDYGEEELDPDVNLEQYVQAPVGQHPGPSMRNLKQRPRTSTAPRGGKSSYLFIPG